MPSCVETLADQKFLVGHESGILDLFDCGKGQIEFLRNLENDSGN